MKKVGYSSAFSSQLRFGQILPHARFSMHNLLIRVSGLRPKKKTLVAKTFQ